MTRNEFLHLVSGRQLLCDGSTGVELSRRGMPMNACSELWILDHPDVFIKMQQDYCAAGSRMLLTPTLCSNRIKLSEHGLQADTERINRELAALSCTAARDTGAIVAGEMGPTGQFMQPMGELTLEEVMDVYRQQAAALIAGGVDVIILETFIDLAEARAAVLAVRSIAPDMPVIASLTFEEGRTVTGSSAAAVAAAMQAAGADAVGANCSTGPAAMQTVLQQMAGVCSLPLFAKPNAGMPQVVEGKTVFPTDEHEFCHEFEGMLQMGVNIVGGCCGTGPDYIRLLSQHLGEAKVSGPAAPCISSLRSVLELSGSLTASCALCARLDEDALDAFETDDETSFAALAKAAMRSGAKAALLEVTDAAQEEAFIARLMPLLTAMAPIPLIARSHSAGALQQLLLGAVGRVLVLAGDKDKAAFAPLCRQYGALLADSFDEAAGVITLGDCTITLE